MCGFDTLQVDEAFIDRVDLDGGRHGAEDLHDTAAHIGVERVVAGQRQQVFADRFGFQQMPGFAHLDAEGFGFGGAGDDTAIVIGEDDECPAPQFGLKHSFAAGVEVVDIDQAEAWRIRSGGCHW